MAPRSCPECGDPLPPRAQACGSCDWRPAARSKNAPDWVCSHTAGQSRCPLPAVWYDSTFATSGWCRLHSEAERRMSGADGYEQLRHIIDHRQAYLDEHYPKRGWRDDMVDALILEHPEWQRGEDEGRSEYVKRMTGTSLRLQAKLKSKVLTP